MFSNVKAISPVEQDFVWYAEYSNGSHYSEFDLITKKENNFYQINQQSTIRFGLIGHNMKLYYETYGGIFKLAGQMLEFIYKVGDKEYYLTGQNQMYNDIITYKDAESSLSLRENVPSTGTITQFNFGYKTNLNIDGVNFHFKPICKIPRNKPIYMNFWLVADQDLDGTFIIKKNGFVVDQFEAPLTKGTGGELNWIIV